MTNYFFIFNLKLQILLDDYFSSPKGHNANGLHAHINKNTCLMVVS